MITKIKLWFYKDIIIYIFNNSEIFKKIYVIKLIRRVIFKKKSLMQCKKILEEFIYKNYDSILNKNKYLTGDIKEKYNIKD